MDFHEIDSENHENPHYISCTAISMAIDLFRIQRQKCLAKC